jgi:hypothetical protein
MALFRTILTGALAVAVLLACTAQPDSKPGITDSPDPELREILTYASRASSSHNAQPWKIEITGPSSLKLLADRSRYLPAVDPDHREMFLSFGAFLETLDQAARALGYRAEITILAGSTADGEIAAIRVEKIEDRRDPAVLSLITSLYTPKGDLGTDPLEGAAAAALIGSDTAAIRYFPPASGEFRWVREQTPRASLQQAWRDPAQEELAEFLHFSKRSAREAGYGLTPEMMEIGPVGRFFWYGFMSRGSALSKSFRNSIEGITSDQLENCGGIFTIMSPDDSPAALIESGRHYQRLKLNAFRRGIGIHPLSSLLEEEPWKGQVDSKLGSDRPVQFILRTGKLQGNLPDFRTDAVTSASIRMKPEQFVSAD